MDILVIYLGIINLISVMVTAYDKKAAIEGEWRISEAALFTLAILGGAVSMWLTMLFIRHKTQKLRFMLTMPLISVAQITAFLFILDLLDKLPVA